ncbi:MAG: phosphotransferase family protein [bacterium]
MATTAVSTATKSHPGNAHERHRTLLAALSTDTFVLGAIHQVGEQQKWWAPGRTWRRTYGRFDPDSLALVTCLFETEGRPQEICRVEVWQTLPPIEESYEARIFSTDLGWLRLTRFPYDPKLSTLKKVLANPGEVKVLRYRPFKRCTIRFEPPEREQAYFVKVFPDEQAVRIHQDNLDLWQTVRKGALDFAVARPLKWQSETRSLWQEAVAGRPILEELFSVKGPELARRMGAALASLPLSTVRPTETLDGDAQMTRSHRYGEELKHRLPQLSQKIRRLLCALAGLHACQSVRKLYPIHGSPHAHQWLEEGQSLGLVDFDRTSLGDPELDVATFLAEMDFEDRTRVPVDRLNAAFLAGFESRFGALDRDLLRAYRAHKCLSKALKAAQAVRCDGDRRAERNLNFALEAIPGGAL